MFEMLVLVVWLAAVGTGRVMAQGGVGGGEVAARGPLFLARAPGSGAGGERWIDVSNATVFRRRISLELRNVSRERALAEIARRAGLRLTYSGAVVQLQTPVTLVAEELTVGAALSAVLYDAGVDVLLTENGRAALVRRSVHGGVQQSGTIVGRVTDGKSGDHLAGAEVFLEGTRWRASTAGDGRYQLVGVEAGSYTLVARRVGYGKQSRAVAVVSEQEVTVDIALQVVATQLDEIVTTVTGEQRLRELGHVVGRINADSLVKEGPISSLSELLNARVPGVQVFTKQGTVGGDVQVQIRGPNSFLLNTEPIVVIDGMRYTNNSPRLPLSFPFGSGPANAEATSPLNDLNPNEIESIEIVKGPSATSLYGTDAANGVVVITTKRGRPGPARWSLYAKASGIDIPLGRFSSNYWGWGRMANGAAYSQSCGLPLEGMGFCTQDSTAVLPNPLNDPELTIFDRRPSWEYGASVSGGQGAFQYRFAGVYEAATGPVQMPAALAGQLKARRGLSELSDEQRDPNTLTKVNLRSSLTAALGDRIEVQANAAYVRNRTRTLQYGAYYPAAIATTPTQPYGTNSLDNPANAFSRSSIARTNRFIGTAGGQWRPAPWLLARVTAGLDLAANDRVSLVRAGDAPPNSGFDAGAVSDDRTRQIATTAELGVTGTVHRGRFGSRTSVGVQYVRNLSDGLWSFGRGLPPGGSSIGEASSLNARQAYRETVTLGGYVEEMIGLNERLFLTGALRVDGASTFGQNYDAAVYPKVSVSWLLSQEPFVPRVPGLDELRLRYALGTSGRQPLPEWGRPSFVATQVFVDDTARTVIRLSGLGNPLLGPERVREHEFGFDVTALTGRVQAGLTWYRRRTLGQIIPAVLPAGVGQMYVNLGLTTQHGYEVELAGQLVSTRLLSWDVRLQHGLHRTNLVDLGGAAPQYSSNGGWVRGYPLGARFIRPIQSFADANGDGLIGLNEVQLDTARIYVGESTPPQSQTLSSVIGLFQRRVRLSALLERRAGFTQRNTLEEQQCRLFVCRAAVDRSTPLAQQAEVAGLQGSGFALIESGNFTRLREVTIAHDLPNAIARTLHVRSVTISVAGRNLALWTNFSGPDPESANVDGVLGRAAEGIPQARSWTVRLDLGL